MRNLQDATERICELKGSLVALDALLPAVIDSMSAAGLNRLAASFDAHAEVARTFMLHSEMSDVVLAAFEREVARNGALLQRSLGESRQIPLSASPDPLLLAVTPVIAFTGTESLSQDSGFFFRRDDQLYLVSARRAMAGREGSPAPDRLEIEVPLDATSPVPRRRVSVALHANGQRRWRDTHESAGPFGVAVMRIAPNELPQASCVLAFEASHLESLGEDIALGDAVSTVGFPLGMFHDNQPVPIARNGSIASRCGMRLNGHSCFLTEIHSDEGSCGSPVLRRRAVSRSSAAPAGWQLLGVHSGHSLSLDVRHGVAPRMALHQSWDASVLMSLTEDLPGGPVEA